MNHIQPDDDIASCRAGHKSSALRMMTNQDAGDSAAGWLAWWEHNELKSEEDWIRDGFRKHGVEVQTPLTQSNIVALLKMTEHTDEEKCGAPSYVQYNAFRWLRDSDFDPHSFDVEALHSEDGSELLQGLIRFAKRSGRSPKDDCLGVLNLGKPPTTYGFHSPMSMPSFQIVANMIVFVPLCTGLLLLWLSCRVAKQDTLSNKGIETTCQGQRGLSIK